MSTPNSVFVVAYSYTSDFEEHVVVGSEASNSIRGAVDAMARCHEALVGPLSAHAKYVVRRFLEGEIDALRLVSCSGHVTMNISIKECVL